MEKTPGAALCSVTEKHRVGASEGRSRVRNGRQVSSVKTYTYDM